MNLEGLSLTQKSEPVPVKQSINKLQCFGKWALNVLSLGIYTTVSTQIQLRQIKKMHLSQEDLQRQVKELETRWEDLEARLDVLMKKADAAGDNQEDIQAELKNITAQKNELMAHEIHLSSPKIPVHFSNVILGIIANVGLVIANILTFGTVGVCNHYALKNRLHALKTANHVIQREFEKSQANHLRDFPIMIESINQYLSLKKAHKDIQDTNVGKAHALVGKAKEDIEALKKEEKALIAKINAVSAKENELALQLAKQNKVIAAGNNQYGNLVTELEHAKPLKEEKELASVKNKLKTIGDGIQELRDKALAFELRAQEIQDLETEATKIEKALAHSADLVKMGKQVGPIPPKYAKQHGDGKVVGAMDIDALPHEFTAKQRAVAVAYNKRYADKKSATEIMYASFDHSFQALQRKGPGSKYQLNNYAETYKYLPLAKAVYRYMIFDILQGARVDDQANNFIMRINDAVIMLSSKSEKILHYKEVGGKLTPEVVTHFQQRDDFTPHEDAFELAVHGVDPIGAKWILERLTEEETGYLITYLTSSLVENNHPDYLAMRNFLNNKKNPRVKLVLTAADLIDDMSFAIYKKFGQNVFQRCWGNNADDYEVEPFLKAEDKELLELAKVDFKDPAKQKIVEWTLDEKVLGKKKINDFSDNLDHPWFVELMKKAKTRHQLIQGELEKGNCTFQIQEKAGKEFPQVDWPLINKYYYHCHQMIPGPGGNVFAGPRCLYSNLLSIFMTNQADINMQNVNYLKGAMANYLEKLEQARIEWKAMEKKAPKILTEEMEKIKEMSLLADKFEKEIKDLNHLTLYNYKNWLRNPHLLGTLDPGQLTAFEIQLAAHTLGVRIGVFYINQPFPSVVDPHGRVMPSEIFGPNTKEIFMMGFINHSYYGINPKLKINAAKMTFLDEKALLDQEAYWKGIIPK